MSGPKSSRYTLSAEQLRKILEEQERVKRELEEKAKRDRECKEAQVILDEILQNTKRHIAFMGNVDDQVKNLPEEFRSKIDGDFSRFYGVANKIVALTSKKITDKKKIKKN